MSAVLGYARQTVVSSLWQRLKDGWASRSLAVGAVATALDLALGTTLLHFDTPTRWAAMAGTLLGTVVGFFANLRFAFRDHHGRTSTTFLKYALVTTVSITIHGQFVVWCCGLGLPFVAAKMTSDFLVFTLGQLAVLRYLVFPRTESPLRPEAPEGKGASGRPHGFIE